MTQLSTAMKVGIVAGIGFFLHAMIPNSNAWPMLWPAAAGMFGVLLTVRKGSGLGFWRSLGVGLKTGAIAATIFFAGAAVSLWLLSTSGLTPLARQLGAEGPINLGAAVVGLAIAALMGLAIAALGAGAAYPIARSRA
jgi:hypothetical protein